MELDGTELGPPPTVKQLAAQAVEFDYNHLIPLRYWLRTADTLLKEVRAPQLPANTPH